MERTRDRVPAHLRRFVVEQDYDRYTAVDQAVWRFILLQTYARLRETAHPAYAHGMAETGMSVGRIPSVAQMDQCLARFGWGAVCVDGFIPPRAFQEFQSLGILPIAAEIRTAKHLPYTPAPDIVHEAAGHAPILPDPTYAEYLRRIGRVGMRAFGRPHDAEIYKAIYRLSVVKERPDATEDEVAQVQAQLDAEMARATEPSEAGLLSRLYWWTVEYGLVGTLDDYRIYGAGLLSSLEESFRCHEDSVRKLPLSIDCMKVDYDITTRQPQLFVAEDFDHLTAVLQEVAAGFAQRVGGIEGLQVACDSQEVGTVELANGQQVTGLVTGFVPGQDGVTVTFAGPCARSEAGRQLQGPDQWPDGYQLTAHPEEIVAVFAGAADPNYWPAQPFSGTRVPAARNYATEQRDLLALYEQAEASWHERPDASSLPVFERVHAALRDRHPRDWLLRWNLLESLTRGAKGTPLARTLARELLELETAYEHRHPIAMGLRYLGHDGP